MAMISPSELAIGSKDAKPFRFPIPVHSKTSIESIKSDGFLDGRARFAVLALTTVCLTLGMCNGTALHFTVICMKSSEGPLALQNASNATFRPSSGEHPMFSFTQQGWLFAALAMGTLVGSLATDYLCSRIGFRHLTTIFGLASGVGTLGTPLASWLPTPVNFYAVFVARLLQGLVLALSFVAAEKLSSKWGALKESTLFIGIVSTHMAFGRVLTMPVAGLLCESPPGWPSVYYLLGVLTIGFFLLFHWFFRELPQQHRKVSRAELARIQSGREGRNEPIRNETKHGQNPSENTGNKYIEMLLDPHAWSVFISDVGMVAGSHVLIQYGPTYLKNAVSLSTRHSGFTAALPFLLSAIMSTVSSRLCDRLQCLRESQRLVVFLTTSLALYAMAIGYAVLALLPVSMTGLVQFIYIVILGFTGLWYVGIVRHVQLVCSQLKNYLLILSINHQNLMASHTACSYFFIILIPSFVNLFIAQENESNSGQWNHLFLIVAGIQLLSGAIVQISLHLLRTKK